MRPHRLLRKTALSSLLLLPALALPSCNNNSTATAGATLKVSGTVLGNGGEAIVSATVYLIPTTAITMTPITSADVLSGAADAYDEPLEDAIRGSSASSFPQATTNASGAWSISSVDTTKKYYPFVKLATAQEALFYPGGNLSRVALTGTALTKLNIVLTGHPSTAATYIGSTECLACHADHASQKKHAHRLGFMVPGTLGTLQDLSNHTNFNDGLAFFKSATTSTFKTAGTSLWLYGYDGTRGFDKFIVANSLQTGSKIRLYLWKDSGDGKYKITMENLVNTSDPDRTYVVDLTYGGALHKQRYMLQVPGSSYKGRYPFLQYQHEGDDSYYDRTRKVFRDYHADSFWDSSTQLFKDPSKTKTIESNCLACHTTGYRYFTDSTTNERLCDGVNDVAGVFDIDGDGNLDELNTGCEVCHGPGSEHKAANNKKYIVQPSYLPPERENQICGRCHDRVAGNDDRTNDQPLNAAGEMAPPGTSRKDFLDNYTSRKGPKLSSFWADEIHSKSHHQQYPDMIKSKHYRNDRQIVVCSDCHDLHGEGIATAGLRSRVDNGTLCATCHVIDITAHLTAKAGNAKTGALTSCTTCHYTKAAKTGAGRRGLLLGTPTGASGDADITYWENDISSHLLTVARKTNKGVGGVTPGSAMPIPYTNRCGNCHDATKLKYQK